MHATHSDLLLSVSSVSSDSSVCVWKVDLKSLTLSTGSLDLLAA